MKNRRLELGRNLFLFLLVIITFGYSITNSFVLNLAALQLSDTVTDGFHDYDEINHQPLLRRLQLASSRIGSGTIYARALILMRDPNSASIEIWDMLRENPTNDVLAISLDAAMGQDGHWEPFLDRYQSSGHFLWLGNSKTERLGILYSVLCKDLYDLGNLDSGTVACIRALSFSDNLSLAHLVLGRIAVIDQEYDRAIHEYRKALALMMGLETRDVYREFIDTSLAYFYSIDEHQSTDITVADNIAHYLRRRTVFAEASSEELPLLLITSEKIVADDDTIPKYRVDQRVNDHWSLIGINLTNSQLETDVRVDVTYYWEYRSVDVGPEARFIVRQEAIVRNLVPNAGFEWESSSLWGYPSLTYEAPWRLHKLASVIRDGTKTRTAEISATSEFPRAGIASLQIPLVRLPALFLVGGAIRAEEGACGSVALLWLRREISSVDYQYQRVIGCSQANDWQPLIRMVSAQTGASYVRIWLTNTVKGRVLFDDLFLLPQVEPISILADRMP